jgi:hypothetical protein
MSGPLLTGLTSGASLAVAHVTVPSLLILGTDAVLAAGPATSVQLAHACRLAGYQTVIPVSWGDELVAARALERLRDTNGPCVQCSCPYVSQRLAEHGDTIAPMLLCLVPPPIATAEYLRVLLAPSRPHITFAGACPAASHQSIDAWLTPDELMKALTNRGISPTSQPTEFDSVIPPDRRRFYSDPGGVPSRHALNQLSVPIDFVELKAEDVVVDLAQQLLQKTRTLIDVAVPLGCSCSGMVSGVSAESARPRVREQEPPRALSPIVDHSIRFGLDGSPPKILAHVKRGGRARPMADRASEVPSAVSESSVAGMESVVRRRSPGSVSRPVLGTMPLKRTEAGRQLPRAYVARRRSSSPSVRLDAVTPEVPPSPHALVERKRWLMVAAAGLAVGLSFAWLIRLLT